MWGRELDLCAECDKPIPARREFRFPTERVRFCGACRSWRAKNLLPAKGNFTRLDETAIEACDMVVKSTQDFRRRNCPEGEPV